MGESFNRIWFQVNQFFARLNNTQRIIFAGIAVVFLAATILTLVLTSSPPFEPLFSDLSPKDAGEIVDRLREQNIDYQLENGGRTVMVPSGRVYDLRVEFARDGLPESGTVGYELFDRQELGITEFQQQITYKRAIEGELVKTIRSIEGVENANVMIVIPKERLFEKDQKVPTASVQLQLRRKARPTDMTIEAIGHLVANSVEGLEPENITITDTRGRILSSNSNPDDNMAMSSDQLAFSRRVEHDLEQKALAVLEKRVGAGNATVQVNASLNWSQVEKTIHDVDPDRTVTISEETSEQTQPGDPNAGSGGSSSSNTVTNYETSKSIQRIVEGVGNIDRISVAVMVNNKPDVKTDPDGNTETTFLPRDAQEMQQLEQLVKMAVGFDNNRSDQFSIVNMQFDPSVEEDLEVMPWWGDPMDIIEKVVIGIALLMGIFLVRSILTSAKTRGDEIQSQIQQILEEEKDKDVKAMKSAEHNHALTGGEQEDDEVIMSDEFFKTAQKRNLQYEQVQHYVRQHPDVATRLIKVWLMEDEEY